MAAIEKQMHSFGATQPPADWISGSTSPEMKQTPSKDVFFLKKTNKCTNTAEGRFFVPGTRTCLVNCVHWSSFDELKKRRKKVKTSVQTLAAILPLIARSGEAPESRSKETAQSTFQNFTASKLQEKKTCTDPFERIL